MCRLIIKDTIKNRIENTEKKYTVKLKRIYKDIKIKNDTPENKPRFEGIKTQIYKKLNDNIPKNVEDIYTIDLNSFIDEMFYSAPKVIYQIIIMRVNIKDTISFKLLVLHYVKTKLNYYIKNYY